MSVAVGCDFPLTAYVAKTVNPSGKRSFVFNARDSLNGVPHDLPCGKCIGCRLQKSRDWAVRMVHESKMHACSSFLTLTYDNDHLPVSGSLEPRKLSLFMKRLRIAVERGFGVRVRFYACGEYGDLNKRPHYHVCLFGFDFPDKRLYQKSPTGDIFTSEFLDGVWGEGSCKVAAFSFETAAYVARYCLKKVDGAMRDAGHYEVYDVNGVVHEREPEFARMSLKPGIGRPYYDKYGAEVRLHDSVVLNGREVPSIRYYDKLFEGLDPEWLSEVKRLRHPVLNYGREAFLREGSLARRVAKHKLKHASMKQKARKL